MRPTEPNLWGIHAGKTGDADSLFLKKHCIAIGWTRIGDPSTIKPDRESFKAKVKLLFDHYDQFDARYKGIVPLHRVFVPEAIEGATE